jgi:hypothetical protein
MFINHTLQVEPKQKQESAWQGLHVLLNVIPFILVRLFTHDSRVKYLVSACTGIANQSIGPQANGFVFDGFCMLIPVFM